MRKKFRILALLLALITVLSVFASCGEGADTTVENGDTDPVTDKPHDDTTADHDDTTATPDGDTTAPDSEIEEPVEEPVVAERLVLNFDTDMSLADYIASVNGIEINTVLKGGDIVDGKWTYSGASLAIKDDLGIFDLEAYTIEFDFCFNSYVIKDNSSVFSLITDDDGTLNQDSSFHIPMKMDTNGTIYHNNAKTATFQVELGKTHHFKLEINRTDSKMSVYVDGFLLVAPTYNQKLNNYNCFRFMDNNKGADMWIDNFVVTDISASLNASTDKLARAIDGAYVRNGKYANEVMPLAENSFIDMKYQAGAPDFCREGLLKFDISKLVAGTVKYAPLFASFNIISAGRTFDIYLISSDWNSETVTYNNMPLGKLIIEDVIFASTGGLIDFAPYIEEALAKGDKAFSIRIVPTAQDSDSQTRLYFTKDNKPYINVYDVKPEKNYFEELVEDKEKNDAIWTWAQQMYDEWYSRYQSLPEVNEDAALIESDQSQYTKTNYASSQSTTYQKGKQAYKTRTFNALTDFEENVSSAFKKAKLDEYGGIKIESMKQKATGYFYTKKIEGRWWMIDPLGYPYISIGLSDIHYSQQGSKLQKENTLAMYGTLEAWALATTRQVRDELNFNSTARPVSDIIAVDDGLPFIYAPSGVMGGYGSIKGVLGDGNGSTVFTENNTMPVFDPDFVSYTDSWAKTKIVYQNEARLIGYTSDNELPMNVDMLDRALSVNHTKEANYYTYACTWTWLCNITGKDNPSADDVTDELRDLYRGFVWDRYYYVVANAVNKYDPNHMYMGTRFLTVSKDSEWVYRFSAQYLDCMTINWYSTWEPQSNALYGIAKNGDMPFVVTEFYTKAGDSGLGNTSGAGWYVATQTDRADFYETFTLKLMESKNCVGWEWFQYMDNDPNSGTGDASSVDSNKGIYASDLSLYTEFTDRMAVLNENVYKLIDYFENKNAD